MLVYAVWQAKVLPFNTEVCPALFIGRDKFINFLYVLHVVNCAVAVTGTSGWVSVGGQARAQNEITIAQDKVRCYMYGLTYNTTTD